MLLDRNAPCSRCPASPAGARTKSSTGLPSTLRPESDGPSTQLDGQGPSQPPATPPEPTLSTQSPPSAPLDTQLSAEDFFALDPEEVPESAAPILAGFLVSYTDRMGRYWPLLQGKTRLGRRGARPDDGPEVPLDEPTVSVEHAIIHASASPGRMKLEDRGSRNGTYVDGVRVHPGQKVVLRDGQLLTLGEFRAVVKII
jgi:hypothetical protein